MNQEEFYDALKNRYQTACFKQDIAPDISEIIEILKISLETTPVFGLDYHHSVKVFGPEYAEDKRRVCWQTVENSEYRRMFDMRKENQPNISILDEELDNFLEIIKTKNLKDNSYIPVSEDELTFNTQVMAPYLLVFKFDPDRYIHKDKVEDIKSKKIKALQSSMAHALSISIIAQHYGIDSGFCGCFFMNEHNKNEIFYDDDNVWLFIGLGYKEDWCHTSIGSKNYKERQSEKPLISDLVDWA